MARIKFSDFTIDAEVSVHESYLEDELNQDKDLSKTATVKSEPSDDEELVCIEFTNGTIDYVPQNILTLI